MDPGPTPRKPRGGWRRHWPFMLFFAAFTAYCAYLQLALADALGRLLLTRVFFQVALAALVVATLRNIVGVRTLGMFAPVIVALAFLATGLPLGLALLGLILSTVLLTRGALVRERVQGAHRVAILVTTVGITISSVALLGLVFNLHELFFSVLFPVLISAWIGERYVEQVTRVGWDGPSKALAWTLGAVVISFMVITQDPLVDYVTVNPLTWPLLVFLNWLLGTRVRFRLSERFRFGGVRRFALGDGPVPGDFGGDVLTMPVRNREFIAKYNPPALMARLSKAEVKALLQPQGVPVAQTYMVLKDRGDVRTFRAWLGQHDRFVLKPASGHGGEGILLVRGRSGGIYDTNMGPLTALGIEAHALITLEGEFHNGEPDQGVVEELLEQHGALREWAPLGLADVRVICFLGFPVMAMMRIPTAASGGKANLHLGAVGAGVRLSSGSLIHCVWRGQPQPHHPDTGGILLGRQVPFWEDVLEVAAAAQSFTGLGFAGVDIALDAQRGPVVMEVNRRPGLEIQNANGAGLLRRLKAIEALQPSEMAVEERLRVVRELDLQNWGITAPAVLAEVFPSES